MIMSTCADKHTVVVVTACMRTDGTPTFAVNEVSVTQEEAENGLHYYWVEAELLESGYEEPFVHFDDSEAPAFLHAAVRQHLDLSPVTAQPIPSVLLEEP
jgi:hypothetical protein